MPTLRGCDPVATRMTRAYCQWRGILSNMGRRGWKLRCIKSLCILCLLATIGCWIRTYRLGNSWIYDDPPLLQVAGRWTLAISVYHGEMAALVLATGPPTVANIVVDPMKKSWLITLGTRAGFIIGVATESRVFVIPRSMNYSSWQFDTESLASSSLPPARIVAMRLPFLFLVLIQMFLPTVWIWRWIRTRRTIPEGCCSRCGYDLRATPDRCPECGMMTDQHAPQDRAAR